MGARRVRRERKQAVPQTPRERLIADNKRVVSPITGRTTWEKKSVPRAGRSGR